MLWCLISSLFFNDEGKISNLLFNHPPNTYLILIFSSPDTRGPRTLVYRLEYLRITVGKSFLKNSDLAATGTDKPKSRHMIKHKYRYLRIACFLLVVSLKSKFGEYFLK